MVKKQRSRRLDELLFELKYVSTLKEAAALIMAGAVYVNGKKCLYPSEKYDISPSSPLNIEIVREKFERKYVSRGGIKLEGAVRHFGIDVRDKVCIDIGSSTGGFTDFLLKEGASKVYAYDVGKNLLHFKISSDPRVVKVENFNFKYFPQAVKDTTLDSGHSYEAALSADIAVCDVSFISVVKILQSLSEGLDIVCQQKVKDNDFNILALVKPQFELAPRYLEKGIVKDTTMARFAVEKVGSEVVKNLKGFELKGIVPSPIKGAAGNEEFFLYLVKKLI